MNKLIFNLFISAIIVLKVGLDSTKYIILLTPINRVSLITIIAIALYFYLSLLNGTLALFFFLTKWGKEIIYQSIEIMSDNAIDAAIATVKDLETRLMILIK